MRASAASARAVALALAIVVALPAASTPQAAAAAQPGDDPPPAAPLPDREELEYRWRLAGVAGFFARLFIPGKGEGRLITRPAGDGLLETELRITSAKAGEEEYWIYGSTLDGGSGRPIEAWNESRFRDRTRRRSAEIEDASTLDIPSGIRFLRAERPARPVRRRLWADGKVYPVEIRRAGRQERRVSGRELPADLYTVRGVEVEGERYWDGGLDVWLSVGEAPVPLEILYRSGRGKVDLELRDP